MNLYDVIFYLKKNVRMKVHPLTKLQWDISWLYKNVWIVLINAK